MPEKRCRKCGVLESIHYPIGLPVMIWDCSKECKEFVGVVEDKHLSLMRCENCMRNITSDEEVWRNRIVKKVQRGIFCSQKCAVEHLDKKQEVSLASSQY